jgi:hypothetical protein
MRRDLPVVVLLVGVAVFFSCVGSSQREKPTIDQKAYRVWKMNEEIFERALQGQQENEDFSRACDFFQNLTGIKIHLNFFTLGILPTPETRQDLEKIRSWYRKNKYRLYWDEATNSVKLRSNSGSSSG